MLTATTHLEIHEAPHARPISLRAGIAWWMVGTLVTWTLLLGSIWGIVRLTAG